MAVKTAIIVGTVTHEPLDPAEKISANIEFLNGTGILAASTTVEEAINALKVAIEAIP